MAFILAISSTTPVYPATRVALQAAYPNTLFPDSLDGLTDFHVYPVTPSAPPDHDPTTHKVVEIMPTGSGSAWTQAWSVVPLTAEEITAQARAPQVPVEDRLAALEARVTALEGPID